ncbi:MAG: hypothetical protein JKY10_09775, partial [Cohaesibacteraceae bacterium]|nr:hypothetical protein [Cohaesibacteraceae bacterium]
RFEVLGDDLVIRLSQDTDELAVIGGISGNAAQHVESFVFADGVVLELEVLRAELSQEQLNDQDNSVNLSASTSVVSFAPGRGEDQITMGADTQLVFYAGDGIDTIIFAENADTSSITFDNQGVQDVDVRSAGLNSMDIILAFPETGDQLLLKNALGTTLLPIFKFTGGVVWQNTDLLQAFVNGQSSLNADYIIGSSLDDQIAGGDGDDDIQGGGGDDIYIFRRGDGRDVIADNAGMDTLEIRGYISEDMIVSRGAGGKAEIILNFENSDDEIVLRYETDTQRFSADTYEGVDKVVFGDGTSFTRLELFDTAIGTGTPFSDEIVGTESDNTLEGGAGDDVLKGEAGNDVYVYRKGDGRDFIDDSSYSISTYSPNSEGHSTFFNDSASTHGGTFGADANPEGLSGVFGGNILKIEEYGPDDVSLYQSPDRLDDLIIRFSATDEILIRNMFKTNYQAIFKIEFESGVVWEHADVVALLEASKPVLVDETISEPNNGFVYEGGLGNDLLIGRNLEDRYVFNRGDGHDYIDEHSSRFGQYRNSTNELLLKGYTPDEVRFLVSPTDAQDMILRFEGTTDEIYFEDFLTSRTIPVFREINFESGETLSYQQIVKELMDQQSSDGDDYITDTGAADTIESGLGNDSIQLTGADNLVIFNAGDGQDEIHFGFNVTGVSNVEIRGYVPAQLMVSNHPVNGLLLTFEGSDDQILLSGGLSDFGQVIFEDGTSFDETALNALTSASGIGTTDGDDVVVGTDGADTIIGGKGDDVLSSRFGEETLIYASGDGHDSLVGKSFFVYSTGDYTVEFTDLNPEDIQILGPVFGDESYEIKILGQDGSVWIDGEYYLRTIVFGNGITWDRGQIEAAVVQRPEAEGVATLIKQEVDDQTFISTSEDEHFEATFLGGNNTYIYAAGGGHDIIDENSSIHYGVFDTLDLSTFTSADVVFDKLGHSEDVFITFGDISGSIRLTDFMGSTSDYGVNQFIFTDVVLNASEVRVLVEDSIQNSPRVHIGTLNYDRSIITGTHFLNLDPLDFVGTRSLILNGVDENTVSYERRGDDLVVTIAPTSEGGTDGAEIWLGELDTFNPQVLSVELPASGTTLDLADVLNGVIAVQQTNGDDIIRALGSSSLDNPEGGPPDGPPLEPGDEPAPPLDAVVFLPEQIV